MRNTLKRNGNNNRHADHTVGIERVSVMDALGQLAQASSSHPCGTKQKVRFCPCGNVLTLECPGCGKPVAALARSMCEHLPTAA